MKKVVLFTLFFAIFANVVNAKKALIYKINFKDEVNSKTWVFVSRGFQQAQQKKADAILLEMNTYGGAVLQADSIRTLILNSGIPVYIFINNNAASAGALIALACDSIYMKPGANIGAATVVNETGQAMPDKYQSYMRSIIRSTAEAAGGDTITDSLDNKSFKWRRDPHIAEAMVDGTISIPGITDRGKVLTFTAREALKYGFCDGIVDNTDQLITNCLGYKDYNIEVFEPTFWDIVKGTFSNPAIQAILIMLIIGGIYFEMQAPGLGLPSLVAIGAAVLYFAPLYIDGLANYWEVLMFIAGCLLLAAEIFIIPGFGIAGISGIVLILCGLFFSLIDNIDFIIDPAYTVRNTRAIFVVISGLIMGVFFIVLFGSRIGTSSLFQKISLQKTLDTNEGYISVPTQYQRLIGQVGICETILRPSGKIRIDGIQYDAIAEDNYIEKGESIIVVKYENAQLYVRKLI